MISFECKNCGGELEIVSEGIGRCTSCRSKQPIPRVNDEKFNRANRLRLENVNFDDARALYESIVSDNPNEAEAYWGIVLCRYGIEYVKDPYTDEYKPTCNRIIESSIQEDADFKKAVSCASDEENREYYISQARMIDKIQQRILSIARTEKPYDIFISFKATDDVTKEETEDSKRATAIYYSLLEKGYRVFFSKITLKDKAGEEYEPYIYAALKSAKIMILVGTKAEYMNAKWVKNEWRRYNKMRLDGERKLLLPVYANMDPYEFPYELCEMQALDMTQMSFMVSLFGNIERFMGESAQDRNARETSENIEKILEGKGLITNKAERWNENGKKFLELGRYEEAIKDFSAAIKENPNYANAYWNRMLASLRIKEEDLIKKNINLSENTDYIMAINNSKDEEHDKYVKIGQLCNGNYNLQNKYDTEINNLIQQYKSTTTENVPKVVRRRVETERNIFECENNIKKYQLTSIASRITCMLLAVVWVFLFVICITSDVTPGGKYAMLLFILGVPSGVASYVISKKFTDRGGLQKFSVWGALLTVGFSYWIFVLISIVQAIKELRVRAKQKKYVYSLDESKGQYKEILAEALNLLSNEMSELNRKYTEMNTNDKYKLILANNESYLKFESKLKQRFLEGIYVNFNEED